MNRLSPISISRRITAEAFGTALLLTAVIGSGIMGERLSSGNVAITLLANTLSTGSALFALILTFISISGAHFNPAVTLSMAWQGDLPWREVPVYIIAQIIGALVGAAVAHGSVEISCEKVFGSGRASQFKPKRAVGRLDRNSQSQEWAALAFKIYELS